MDLARAVEDSVVKLKEHVAQLETRQQSYNSRSTVSLNLQHSFYKQHTTVVIYLGVLGWVEGSKKSNRDFIYMYKPPFVSNYISLPY